MSTSRPGTASWATAKAPPNAPPSKGRPAAARRSDERCTRRRAARQQGPVSKRALSSLVPKVRKVDLDLSGDGDVVADQVFAVESDARNRVDDRRIRDELDERRLLFR